MSDLLIYLLLIVLVGLFFFLNKEIKPLLKEDRPSYIPLVSLFSFLFRPSKHFKAENKTEGYLLYFLQTLIVLGVVYILIVILKK